MVVIHGTRRRERALAKKSRVTLYILNFVFSLHLAMVSYFMSTFLVSRGFPQEFVGVLYAVGSIITLFSMAKAPYLLKKYGNYTNLLALGLLELLAFIGLSVATYLPFIFLLFAVVFIVPTLIAFSLDIFLEGATDEHKETSGIRGTYLTVAATAWVVAPLLGGVLVEFGGYSALFVAAAAVFSPFVFIAAGNLKAFKDPHYIQLNIPKFMETLVHDSDLRNVFVAQFLLRVFYAIMVIYLPLYVNGVLGMPISYIGILVAFATLAFVLLEIPLGRLQDSRWGEKEVLVIGFVIIALFTACIPFVASASLLIWLPLLFATRVGAAMIEVASEGYFFKHADAADADDVSAFRMLFPLSYIISPVVGTVFLFFFPLNTIFLALAVVMLTGVLAAGALNDTK